MKKAMCMLLLSLLAVPGVARGVDLDYSTFLGGSSDDVAYAVALDSSGNAYLAGDTLSLDFPTQAPYQAAFASSTDYYRDVFVAKFASSGGSLIFSTYLGGSLDDGALGDPVDKLGLALDESRAVYVAGRTTSLDFPTQNPFQAGNPGYASGFVTKLDSSGNSLIFSTYLGGGGNDAGCAIAVDGSQCPYVTGATGSSAFPTLNAFQPVHGGGNDDAFLTKFHSDGASLLYSTYLGGDGHDDGGYALAVDSGGCAYVTGECDSEDFPTLNPFDPGLDGYSDVFLTKFHSDGSTLVYSTYLGGASYDTGFAIALDSDRCAYLTGSTVSDDFPTLNPYQAEHAINEDVFVTKFASAGSSLVFSTYLGGEGWDTAHGIALDAGRFVYLAGSTSSTDFPLKDPYQDVLNLGQSDTNYDSFASKLCCMGNFLLYSTYLGGGQNDYTYGMALNAEEQTVFLGGCTDSDDFPTVSPWQGSRAGDYDAFLAKLGYTPSLLVIPNGDYDGDGTDDLAVFRPAEGLWVVRGVTRAYFGTSVDTPACGDYNGDGTTDLAFCRTSIGLWKVRGLTRLYYLAAGDYPVPGDYNGDGTTQVAIWRNDSARWMIRNDSSVYFGRSGDIPVPADYDGDGSDDLAYFRGGTRLWKVRGKTQFYFAQRPDQAVPGDYDGDGTEEAAFYRPLSNCWAARGVTRLYFGNCAARPVPADYSGDGTDEMGFFSSYQGFWKVLGVTRLYFGRNGDIPVTR